MPPRQGLPSPLSLSLTASLNLSYSTTPASDSSASGFFAVPSFLSSSPRTTKGETTSAPRGTRAKTQRRERVKAPERLRMKDFSAARSTRLFRSQDPSKIV